MKKQLTKDKSPNERLKEFIVNDTERIIRINMKKSESIARKEEKKSEHKVLTVEEKLLNNIYK